MGRTADAVGQLPAIEPERRQDYEGDGSELTIIGHDDWLVFATTPDDPVSWYVVTELWPEHGDAGDSDFGVVYRHLATLSEDRLTLSGKHCSIVSWRKAVAETCAWCVSMLEQAQADRGGRERMGWGRWRSVSGLSLA